MSDDGITVLDAYNSVLSRTPIQQPPQMEHIPDICELAFPPFPTSRPAPRVATRPAPTPARAAPTPTTRPVPTPATRPTPSRPAPIPGNGWGKEGLYSKHALRYKFSSDGT